jgi:GT2 family glycosyltransferase
VKYSFVIPTYNKKEPLKRTLESLNNFPGYTRDDIETVVVDDGSSAEMFPHIKGINRNYRMNYVYLQRCEDSCRSRARNYGIKVARGSYVIFIDDDIVVNKDYLKELDRYYRFSDNLVITGLMLNCPPDLLDSTDVKELKREACRLGDTRVLEMRHLAYNRLSYNLSSLKYPWLMSFGGNLIVPRKLLLEIGGFDENFRGWGYEDFELGYRLFKAGGKFVVNPRLEVIHQVHPQSPRGENNYEYFVEKCKDAFKDIEPGIFLSLPAVGINNPRLLALFRKYQGKIRNSVQVELHEESQLENVKKSILHFAKKKGSEVIVNDYCENTDLDIWAQMQDFSKAIISYFPQSMKISGPKRYIKKI